MRVTSAVVLAGGLGTRLGDLARDVPKPMLPVAGVPFLDHVVWNLRRHGITDVVFSIGHLAEVVRDHVGDGSALGIRARYAVEDSPLGTGGAVALAAEQLSDDAFLVLNGDTLFDLNYLDLALALDAEDAPRPLAAMALRPVPDAGRYGSVELAAGRVRAFAEKSAQGAGLVNGGVYVLRRELLERLPSGPSSLERDLFPALAAEGALVGRAYDGFFVDIGIPESLSGAQRSVAAWRRKPALFLDRDGTLNIDRGWLHEREEFEWTPDAREAVKYANDAGWLAIVITNQAGIGRGIYTEAEFHEFSAWIGEQLAEVGAHVDATYYCPHHPEAGLGEYLRACECRKPAPGMLLTAIREWDVDAAASVFVGDNDKDMAAGEGAGVRTVRFSGGSLLETVRAALDASARNEPQRPTSSNREGL